MTEYWYDDDGNISRQSVKVDVSTTNITDYSNNYFNKPDSITAYVKDGDIFGNDVGDTGVCPIVTSYTYDDNGNIETLTQQIDNSNSVVTTYTYDDMNSQIGMSQPGADEYDNTVTISTATIYNWNGNPLISTDANGNQTAYTYESAGPTRKSDRCG